MANSTGLSSDAMYNTSYVTAHDTPHTSSGEVPSLHGTAASAPYKPKQVCHALPSCIHNTSTLLDNYHYITHTCTLTRGDIKVTRVYTYYTHAYIYTCVYTHTCTLTNFLHTYVSHTYNALTYTKYRVFTITM